MHHFLKMYSSLFRHGLPLLNIQAASIFKQNAGTDDDLPPSHQTRVARGSRITGNGRGTVVAYDPRSHNDMESQIHRLEQEAYTSVLRAFKAQSDAITWVFIHWLKLLLFFLKKYSTITYFCNLYLCIFPRKKRV